MKKYRRRINDWKKNQKVELVVVVVVVVVVVILNNIQSTDVQQPKQLLNWN
jgi:hypothetical protein